MKWTREQYLDLMTFGQFDRPMFVELFGLLIGLDEEWRAQGAHDDEISLEAFDWDWVPLARTGGHTGMMGGHERAVLEETEHYRVERDALGRTVKLDKRTATIPLPMDFPVKSMDDWLKLKPWFTWSDDRINDNAIAEAKRLQAEGHLVIIGIPGAFDMARELMGEEVACLAYYDDPELMHDIVDTLTATATRVLERVTEKITVDQLSVHEDFAGKSGPLVGPQQIAEYFTPLYRGSWDIVQSRGGRIFGLDTDGNINSVIDALLDCGITEIHPMEPAAGMDIVQLREKYGNRLAMRGGIDKFALMKDRAAIDRELEYKLQPKMREAGGIAFGLDHRIPNGVPLENYRYYVARGREILGLPPLEATRRGWARTAF